MVNWCSICVSSTFLSYACVNDIFMKVTPIHKRKREIKHLCSQNSTRQEAVLLVKSTQLWVLYLYLHAS